MPRDDDCPFTGFGLIAQGERVTSEPQKGNGAAPPRTSGPCIVDAAAPYDAAKLFRDAMFCASGNPILFHHRGAFYCWNGTAYPEFDDADLRSRLYCFLDQCVTVDKHSNQQPFKPNKSRVANVIDGLEAATNLSSTISAPAWLDQSCDLDPADIIVCSNGLLHLPTLDLLPHTPVLFTYNALDFGYEPSPQLNG